jgi:hypothetical protein
MDLLPRWISAKLLASGLLTTFILAFNVERSAADILFSTLGPGDTYDSTFAGLSVNGQNASGTLYAANAFQPLFDGNLLSIELGITNYDIQDGGSGAIVLHLYANDTATNTPITSLDLATGTLTATAATGSTNSALTIFTYSGPTLLLSHSLIYWLALAPASDNTTVHWQQSLPAISGKVGTSPDGMTYSVSNGTLEAFRVNAAPVPEPTAFALSGLGAVLLLVCRSKRKS